MLNLSILITCYNKEKYLNECVESVLRQTRQPKEIIIVHDECEEPMHHVRATSIFLEKNVGVEKARHEAFRFSSGELILFVDGDDVLSPDYLEKMCLVLHDGADIAYPDLFLWAGDKSQLVITPDKITPEFVRDFKRVVIPVTSLMRRSVYEKLDGFKKWEVLEDLDFFIRAMCKDYIFRKAQTLLWYRRAGVTRNMLDTKKRKEVLEEIMSQFHFTKDKIWQK